MKHRRSNRIAVLGLVTLTALGAAAAIAQAVAPSVTLRAPDQLAKVSSSYPHVASGPAGRSIAAWAHKGAIATSDLAFGAWTTPAVIPGSADGEYPVAAMSSAGHVIVAWQVEHGHAKSGAIGVSYRAPGGSFKPAVFVGTTTGGATNVEIAMDINSTGRAVITWDHHDDGRSVQALFVNAGAFGAVQTVDSGNASGSSVAIDDAGRAIVIYTHQVPSASESAIRQALAPAGGTFGAPSVVDGMATGEHNGDSNPRVAANASGAVVAGWSRECPSDCPSIWFTKMGIGDTTSGITSSDAISNAGNRADRGPERKSGGATEVAIDDAGNRVLVGDFISSDIATAYEYRALFVPAGGTFGPSVAMGTNTGAIPGDVRVALIDGRAVASWTMAPAAGENGRIQLTQSTGGDWSAVDTVTPANHDADLPELAASADGTVALVYRSNDRAYALTNAPRDTTRPAIKVPRAGTRFVVSRASSFVYRVQCPAREAECSGTVNVTVPVRANGRTKHVKVGTGTFLTRGGTTAPVVIKLTRSGKVMLARSGQLAGVATTVAKDAAGNATTLRRTAKLAKPRRSGP